MASIYDANTNYQIAGVDLEVNPGLVTREYLIDVYPSLANQFKTAGLWLWGWNAYGQLGDNTIASKSSPVQTVSGGANWKQIAMSEGHTAAIKTDGTLWLWGGNASGELGDNTATSKSSPVQTIAGGTNWKQVDVGFFTPGYSGAVKSDGTLWMWGGNGEGQLGDNSVTSRASPVQTVAAGTNWKQVSCGDTNNVGAVKTDGTLWVWGRNNVGQLGDGSTTNRSSPVQTVAGGTNWTQVSAGGAFFGAVKSDGTLWLWGGNASGQLGDNTSTSKSSPVQTVAAGTNWKHVSCGGTHTAALKTDGTLWTWGLGTSGQLGDNTATSKSSPVQTVSGGTNWKQVSCGGTHTAALKTDGTLWTWGLGTSGQLGDNSVTSKSSPVQTVSGGTNWKAVSVGDACMVTIRDDSSDPFRSEPL